MTVDVPDDFDLDDAICEACEAGLRGDALEQATIDEVT